MLTQCTSRACLPTSAVTYDSPNSTLARGFIYAMGVVAAYWSLERGVSIFVH